MKRAILTLVALGALVPLAAQTAKAGGRERERKTVSVEADRGGISIGYRHTEVERSRRADRHDSRWHRRDDRGDVRRREVRVRLGRLFDVERKRWVPGYHVWEERQVRLPDRYEDVWVPARYEMRRDACGHRYRVLVEDGHHERRLVPGRVIVKKERVWVPGHWERY